MAKNLPGLNYESKLLVADLKFQVDETEKAILDRTTIVFGSESLASPKYGIADEVNPNDLVSTETSRPLVVYLSTNNPLRINVSPGTAICPNGAIIRNTGLVEDFELIRTNANDILVIYVENEIIDDGAARKTRYNTDLKPRRIQNTSFLRSELLSTYNSPVIFPPSRLDNIVVICVISVATASSGLELQFDYTNSVYSFNRPWYTPVDVEHRSKVGTGLVTSSNPHGLSFNDLSSGNLTLYDQLLQTGYVEARDDDVKGVPGSTCFETLTPSRILTDGSGAVTSGSKFGGPGSKYVVLARYPVFITAFYRTSHKGRAIAFDHIKGSRIVVLPTPETFTENATIEYNEVLALAPPSAILSNTLAFGQPNAYKELVISGGVSFTTLSNPFIDFDGSGPVPRDYKLYVKGDGSFIRTPQPIQTTFLLDDFGTALQTISASTFGPAKITIGLADALSVPTMVLKIKVFGKDVSGNAINEELTFLGTTWTPVPLPGIETPTQYLTTSQVFANVSNFQVTQRTDDGPSSKIVMWAELETETSVDLNKLALVAYISWDGLAISKIQDMRRITQTIPEIGHRFASAAEWQGLGGTAPVLVASEDFTIPKLRDTTSGTQVASNAVFQITIADAAQIQAADSIQFGFAVPKTLTAITAGVPNRAIGQYLATTSEQDTRDDIILTINDVTFASGVVAAADVAINKVNCTVSLAGSRGNIPITEPVEAIPTAIILSGNASGGIDDFGETYTLRHQNHIDSLIPNPITYNVSSVRSRYLSVAIPIKSRKKIRVVVHQGFPIQVRMRVAFSSPEWMPWEVLTGNGQVFELVKADDITKIQLEIFGRCSGYSLFEMNP